MRNPNAGLLVALVVLIMASWSHAQIVITDDMGRMWSDLHFRNSEDGSSQDTGLDFQTLKNAKLACLSQGGRLPELSEVNALASWISREFLLKPDTHQQGPGFSARFMHEPRAFWTATVKQESDRYVFNRAIARLSTLRQMVDMSKAESVYVPATQDSRLRPFLCVFGAAEEPCHN